MTPDFIHIQEPWNIDQVLAHIRKVGTNKETFNALYVTDPQQHLIDDIRLRDVLLAPPETLVRELMDRQYVALNVTDPEFVAVEKFRKYDRTVLPVIDRRGVLLGVVTVDDVLDVAEESATREIQKFGGLEALDEPYIATPLLQLVRKRGTWLIVLFLGELLTASAMGVFEKEIEKAVVLALFVPLIISSGGNSGSQASTLIIQAMALGEITIADWWTVVRREIISGLMLGAVLGIIGFTRVMLWNQIFHTYGDHSLLIASTVGFSLVGVVLWGTIAGSMLPIVLKKFGADPATSSAPFVATLVDVTGLVIYFSVAFLIMRGILL